MAEHDFRYSLLNPQHTLTECRALAPSRYQVTGNGGSIQANDVLLVTLKGSRDLHMRLEVEKVRHLINPPGQWLAVCKGPQFKELAIHNWQVNCDSCGKQIAGFNESFGELQSKATRLAQMKIRNKSWGAPAGA